MKKNKLSFSGWKIFLRSSLVCGALTVLIGGMSLERIEPLPLNMDPLEFNGQNAFDKMKALAKGFPNRVTWSRNRVLAGAWLKSELKALGYAPQNLLFSEVIAGKQYSNLENIYVEKKGTLYPDEIIMAVAHYDITDTTVEGAMDDASGVGVVLELARIFKDIPNERTLIFLLTDSEEFGAFWGARAFAQNFPRSTQIVAALNFDFVAPEKQTKILTLCDGLRSGFTPLWLRELALNSIRSLGTVEAVDLAGIEEFVERALLVPAADHGAFLNEGIPSFNWVGQTDRFAYEMAHYHHTQYDVAEALEPQSFTDYGSAAERTIRSLLSLPKIPDSPRDASYWKLSERYYISGTIAFLIHVLAFIPFLIYSVIRFTMIINKFPRKKVWMVFQTEAKLMGILLGSLLVGYVLILLMPALRIITQYEAFPATQKSLLLYTPNFVAILVVLGSIGVVYWVFRKVFDRPSDIVGHAEVRHVVHAASMTVIIFLAFAKNSYLACLLLLPPAYLWTILSHRKNPEDRVLNGLLLFGGSITFVALIGLITTVFDVGVFYWYIFLSAAYGLISAYTVVLFFMAITVMIRLFRSFVL